MQISKDGLLTAQIVNDHEGYNRCEITHLNANGTIRQVLRPYMVGEQSVYMLHPKDSGALEVVESYQYGELVIVEDSRLPLWHEGAPEVVDFSDEDSPNQTHCYAYCVDVNPETHQIIIQERVIGWLS